MILSRKERFNRKLDKMRDAELAGKPKKRLIKNRAVRKMLNNRLAVIGAAVFIVIVLACIFAPLLTPYNPEKPDLRNLLKPPSAEHILGTDKIGRDIFARILYGGRISMIVGLGGALGAAIIGAIIGSYAGYKGGWFDRITLRLSELFMSFPQLVLVLMLVTIVGQSMRNIIIIFVLTGWGSVYRQARARMLSLREEEYVQSLKAFGLSDLRIVYKHMLPNAISPLIVNMTLSTAMYILEEAALSYLGLGIPLNIPTWGNILNACQDMYALQNGWWMWLPVGATISLFVMSINFIGDGLRDTTDPSQQG